LIYDGIIEPSGIDKDGEITFELTRLGESLGE
jgi:hypothetical protein